VTASIVVRMPIHILDSSWVASGLLRLSVIFDSSSSSLRYIPLLVPHGRTLGRPPRKLVRADGILDASEVVVDDYGVSSFLLSWAPVKASIIGRIACPMRSVPTPLGWCL
jgi:hypothetical protein